MEGNDAGIDRARIFEIAHIPHNSFSPTVFPLLLSTVALLSGKQLVDSFGRKVTLKSADSQWKDEGSEGVGRRRPLREDEILPRLNLDDESVDLRPKDRQPHPVELLTAW